VRTTSLNRLGEKRLELPTGSPEEAASATLPSEPDVDSNAITAHLKPWPVERKNSSLSTRRSDIEIAPACRRHDPSRRLHRLVLLIVADGDIPAFLTVPGDGAE